MIRSLHQLRAGVIGTGFIGPVHIEALKRLGVQVTAVCGSNKSAKATAEKWGIPEVYGGYDYHALLRSPNVDIVHITSPNKSHVEQSLAALAAGKHVVCEKPLGMTSKETARVVKQVRKAQERVAADRSSRTTRVRSTNPSSPVGGYDAAMIGPVFAVNYMCRFFPAVLQIRAMVQRGDLGQIIHVQGHFFQDWLLKETDYNWRLLASEGGKLRAVGDIGTHWIDAVSFILGARAESVFAHLETFHKTRLRPKGEVQTFAGVKTKSSSHPFPLPTGWGKGHVRKRSQREASYSRTDLQEKRSDLIRYKVDTEDFGSVLLKFGRANHGYAEGVHANAFISQVAAGWKCSLYIGFYGTKGSVQWEFQQPNEIIVGHRDEPNQILQRATAGFSEDIVGFTDYPGGHPEGFPDSHKMQYRAVYEHIASGRTTPALFATVEDGHHEVQLCEAIAKSSVAGKWVKV